MPYVSKLISFLAVASGAFAVSVSSSCLTALTSVAVSPQASCIDASGIFSLATSSKSVPLIPQLTDILENQCAQEPCTNDAIEAIFNNVTKGCDGDIASLLGISTSEIPADDILAGIKQYYPVTKQILCLKNSTSDVPCLTQILDFAQSFLGGDLTIQSIIDQVSPLLSTLGSFGGLSGIGGIGAALGGSSPFNGTSGFNLTGSDGSGGLPFNFGDNVTSLICDECTTGAVAVFEKAFPDLSDDINVGLSAVCGANFTDAPTPTSVVQGTGAAAARSTQVLANKNSATRLATSVPIGLVAIVSFSLL